MHDDELRTRLASLNDHDTPTPAPDGIRARGRRRRHAAFGAGAAAVVTVALAVVGASGVLLRAPFEAVPASPSMTPITSPSPTVSASRVTPSPGLTCEVVRSAWRDALTSKIKLPAVLGSKPRLEWVSGDAWVASGVVRGQRIVRVFPDGLAGSSYALPPLGAGVELLGLSRPDGRVVYIEQTTGTTTWSLMTVDAPGSTPRQVMVGGARDGDRWTGMPWTVGDVVRYIDAPDDRTDAGPAPVLIYEISLTVPDAVPRVVLDFSDMARSWMWGYLGGEVIVMKRYDGSLVALNRRTLAEVPVPPMLDGSHGALASDTRRVLYRGGEDKTELWVLDTATSERRPVVAREPNWATISGHLVLSRHGPRVLLSDLDTGNSLEVLTTATGYNGAVLSLSDGILSRFVPDATDDPGLYMSIADLPQSIPAC